MRNPKLICAEEDIGWSPRDKSHLLGTSHRFSKAQGVHQLEGLFSSACLYCLQTTGHEDTRITVSGVEWRESCAFSADLATDCQDLASVSLSLSGASKEMDGP